MLETFLASSANIGTIPERVTNVVIGLLSGETPTAFCRNNGTTKEGLGSSRDEYTYYPNKSDPNLLFTFRINDLAIDLSSACAFIKLDSQLKNVKSAQQTPSPSTTDNTTMTPSPYSEQDDAKPVKESLATNSPVTNSDSEYTLSYSQLSIYKMYIEDTGYSKNTNDNTYKKMDDVYGTLFDSSYINKLPDSNIEKLWNSNKSITIDDAIYNGVYYFAVQPYINTRKCAYSDNETTGLSSYFLKQIIQNKTRPSILLSLKNAYYAIIKPRFLMNKLSTVYWKNAASLTNSDKGTVNSVLYVLNTCGELGQTNTLDKDLSANNVANIMKDSSFTKDSLRIYQIMSVGFELYRFVAYFEKNGASTSGKGTAAITTTYTNFISGHPEYLNRINQVKIQSPLAFLMTNPPNNRECPIVDKLAPFMTTVES
jgi:hypothetical protein